MEEEVEHNWEYIGNHFVFGKYERYEFRCRRCGLSALCKGKKLNFLQVEFYSWDKDSWDKDRICFVFGVGEESLRRGGKVINNYFVGSPKNALEPACISQDDWDVFNVLI